MVCNELEKCVPAIKAVSPSTFVLARITGHDWIDNPGEAAGRQRVRDLVPLFGHVPADCFSIANEWIPRSSIDGIQRGVETYLGALDEAYKNNIEIAVGDLNTGYPDLDKPGVYEAIRPLLERAKYLNVHYYARNGDPAGDPDALVWVKLVREFPKLRVIIGELGVLEHDGAMPHGAAFEAFCRAADNVWSLWRNRLVGAALFTWKGFDSDQWESARWEQDAPIYSAYLKERESNGG